MKKVLFFAVVAMSAMMVSCNKQAAQTEDKEVLEATEMSPEVAAIRVANDLAKHGYATESPLALIEAADILATTPTRAFGDSTKIDEGVKNPDAAAKEATQEIKPEQLLADARKLTDDATILALIDQVEAKIQAEEENKATRGNYYGPKYGYYRVYANSYMTFDEAFTASQLAEVVVSGDRTTDLDLYVYDENGNLIASDTDYSDQCYVSFRPRWSGWFRIKVLNRGSVYNDYSIATN